MSRPKVTHLLVKEFEIRSTFVLDISFRLFGLIVPVLLLFPLIIILFFLIIIVAELKVLLLLRLFPVCIAD